MSAGRWTPRKVAVVGPSGRETPVEAKVRTPEEASGWDTIVSIGLMACLVVISFFVPPVLLLNIPILIARAALSQTLADWENRVWLDAFACPECGRVSEAGEQKGTLPLDTTCAACAAPLVVRPPPRRNLVEEPFPGP